MNLIKMRIKQLHRENRDQPRELREIHRADWPDSPPGAPIPFKVWRSSTFLVQGFHEDGCTRLSVNRTMIQRNGQWHDDVTWDDLQRLKHEAGFGDSCAIEFYPPDADVVNVANMRHLWIVTDRLPRHWRNG